MTDVETNADALIKTLKDSGIDHVLTNAGTDTAPIIESLAKLAGSNEKYPQFLVTPHENLAMAMAHGYYRRSAKPAAVLLHTTVGSANGVMGAMNALRDQVPIVMLAGRTPNTESGQLGSRSAHIHWGQETFDQASMMRDWLKWDYEARTGQPMATLVRRAIAIAKSQPPGPIYLTLPREVLAGPSTEPQYANETDVTASAMPNLIAIEKVAHLIMRAQLPLIVTSSGGRSREAFQALSDLAARFAIPIAQPFATDANVPSNHDMNFGFEGMTLVKEADLILVIEAGVPWVGDVTPNANSTVVQIAADPQYMTYPLRGFKTDMALSGDIALVIAALQASLPQDLDVGKRHRLLTELQTKRRQRIDQAIKASAKQTPISTIWLADCLNRVKNDLVDETVVVINELGVPPDYLDLSQPRSYMRESTAGGLGFGLGAALGNKLADRDACVIAVVGDGSYMLGNPTPAHFMAHAYDLPTLTIVNNNQRWQAVHNAASAMYPDGHATRGTTMPLTGLTPSPAYEKVVEASDGYGEKVTKPKDLIAALERGIEMVDAGKPAVINVVTAP